MNKLFLIFIGCILYCIPSFSQEVIKQPDARNKELLEFYNRDYDINSAKIKVGKPARNGFAIYKATKNSILSNDEIEMYFEVEKSKCLHAPLLQKAYPIYWYQIMLTNKTNEVLYVDKQESYRVPSIGEIFFYYDSVYNTGKHSLDRYVVIPPHSTVPFLRNKLCWCDGPHYVENAESYTLSLTNAVPGNSPYYMEFGGMPISYIETHPITKQFRPSYKSIECGDIQMYDESNTPFSVSYFLKYSRSPESNIFSQLTATFYVSQIVPLSSDGKERAFSGNWIILQTKGWNSKSGDKSIPATYINGYTDRTLVSPIGYHKIKGFDGDLDVLLEEANSAYLQKDYKTAFDKYCLADKHITLESGKQAFQAGISCYETKNYSKAKQFFYDCYNYRDLDDNIYEILPAIISKIDPLIAKQNADLRVAEERANQIYSTIMNAVSNFSSAITNAVTLSQRNKLSNSVRFQSSHRASISEKKSAANTDDDDDKDDGYDKECPKCDGKGFIVVERPHTKAGKELEVDHVTCAICEGEYDANSFDHKHETCPKCKGNKIVTY